MQFMPMSLKDWTGRLLECVVFLLKVAAKRDGDERRGTKARKGGNSHFRRRRFIAMQLRKLFGGGTRNSGVWIPIESLYLMQQTQRLVQPVAEDVDHWYLER
jgi:hypothetical protein